MATDANAFLYALLILNLYYDNHSDFIQKKILHIIYFQVIRFFHLIFQQSSTNKINVNYASFLANVQKANMHIYI